MILVEMNPPIVSDGMRTTPIESPISEMVKFEKSPLFVSNATSLTPSDSTAYQVNKKLKF